MRRSVLYGPMVMALLLVGCGQPHGESIRISSGGSEDVASLSDPEATETLRSAASHMVSVGMFSFSGTITKSDEQLEVDGTVASSALARVRVNSTLTGQRETLASDNVMYVRSGSAEDWVAMRAPLRVVGVNPAALLPALEQAIDVNQQGEAISFSLTNEASQRFILAATTEAVSGQAVVVENWIERLAYRASMTKAVMAVDLVFGPSSPDNQVTIPADAAVQSFIDMADTGSP